MSQENLEIVRAVSEAINRGDVDAALKHWAPDCEFDVSRAVGPVHGTDGLDRCGRPLRSSTSRGSPFGISQTN